MNNLKFRIKPYLIAWLGIILDYATTCIALATGNFIETHPNYSPLYALAIFTGAVHVLDRTLPSSRRWNIALCIFTLLSWLGPINNILTLAGIIGGLWL